MGTKRRKQKPVNHLMGESDQSGGELDLAVVAVTIQHRWSFNAGGSRQRGSVSKEVVQEKKSTGMREQTGWAKVGGTRGRGPQLKTR